MKLPESVEPFLEPEPGVWSRRLASLPFVKPVIGGLLLVALWLDAVRQGALPAWSAETIFIGTSLSLAAVAAVAIGAGWRKKHRPLSPPTLELPRLPVFLRFDGRRVVVVGGGTVAASKIPALLAAGAAVTVVAPKVVAEIDRSKVTVIDRAFRPSDLDSVWFVTAAATPEVNRQVRDAADSRGIFVNAVDDPANATAYLGGTISRGGVTVAFSTSGQAPALAGLLREAFDELLPPDIELWLTRARELSRQQRAADVPVSARRPQLLEALNRLYASSSQEPRS